MKKVYIITSFFILLIILSACKKKRLNEDLYEEAKAPGLALYKNKDSILSPAGSSPHGNFKLKFNTIAASRFDNEGKLPAGAAFPDGSLIVKEVYSGNAVTLYVVMKKEDSKFSANGWLWGEYAPDGDTKYSVGNRGKECTSCHSASPNRDFTRSFDLH